MSKFANPDVNQAAARVVGESTDPTADPLPAALEQAWQEWSGQIKKVDQRTLALLRAAFEAGVDAQRNLSR